MTFQEAFDRLISGEKITVPNDSSWNYGQTYWVIQDGIIQQYRNDILGCTIKFCNLVSAQQQWIDGWQIYIEPRRFKDLKPGQKFVFENNRHAPAKTRLGNNSYLTHTWDVVTVVSTASLNHEVILID